MFHIKNSIAVIFTTLLLVLSGCSGGGSSSDGLTSTSILSGVAQKGPFVEGSKVTVYKLSSDYNITDTKVQSVITDAQGHYSVRVPWSGPSKIVVEGKYLDETTAKESNSSITLSSYFEATSGVPVVTNVNILTDLASIKILKLLQESNTTLEDAKKVANQELDEMFELAVTTGLDIDTLDITELQSATASVNAELLRLSAALLKVDNPEDSLEKLKLAYRDTNVSEVKKMTLFQELQILREDVNLTLIAQNLEINTSNIENILLVEVPTGVVYDDINLSMDFKSSQTIGTNFTQDENISIINNPAYGNASSVLVGNEIWYFTYAHSSCSLVSDSFLYSTGLGIGQVNVSINEPQLVDAQALNLEVINQNKITNRVIIDYVQNSTLTLNQNPLHGDANITIYNNQYVLNYTPDSQYVGTDNLEYTFVQTVDGCPFTKTATININVIAKTFTYDDINISVPIKGTASFATNATQTQTMIFSTVPTNGIAGSYLVGNESWYIEYNETSCGASSDSFIYETEAGYGRVNVTIVAPTTISAVNKSNTLFNTEVLTAKYLMPNNSNLSLNITTSTSGGASSFTIIGNEDITYNYDPDNSFVGNDFFEYTMTQTINECPYSDTGRIDFIVEAPLPSLHLFSWNDGVHGIELWRTDGEVNGTVMVKDINPGSAYSNAGAGVKINDLHYFSATDGNSSYELWKTDGTESGTYMVKDINPGESDGSFPSWLSVIGETMYFFALNGDNNGSSSKGNKGLYKSDGTEAGTLLVEDFGDFSLTSYSAPGYLSAYGNILLFLKDDAAGGGAQWEPWISNGSASSSKLKDIWPGDEGSGFRCEIQLSGKCYGSADDYTHGAELWVSNGTEVGTNMLLDINENNDSSTRGSGSVPSNLTLVGNQFFFTAFDTVEGVSLWKSDGTPSGTVLVKDSFDDANESLITRFGYRDNYDDFVGLNGVLYFVLDDGVHGQEIWKSDGTTSGTVMLKDIGNGSYSAPSNLVNVNGTLYFWFSDGDNDANSGLWTSDGTETGTVLIKAFSSNDFELSGSGITTEDSKAYVEVLDYANSSTRELWISNGTEVGTFKLVDGESMGGGF